MNSRRDFYSINYESVLKNGGIISWFRYCIHPTSHKGLFCIAPNIHSYSLWNCSFAICMTKIL